MEMVYYQLGRSSYKDSLKELEADIQHANALLAAIPNPKGDEYLQMKLVYNELAPLFFLLLQWLDGSCSCLFPLHSNLFHILIYEVHPDESSNITTEGSKATVREFYTNLLPSLQKLHNDLVEQENSNKFTKRNSMDKKSLLVRRNGVDDQEREDECGICLVPSTKMVLPGCCHAMCINCYRDWNTRSESCPFCRRGLKRVKSEDLWVLTNESEVIDAQTVLKKELSRFYLYIQSLPKDTHTHTPDGLFWVHYDEYLI